MSFDRYLTEAVRRQYSDLERALGYRFKNPALLRQALTHKSAGSVNYEDLEFIGDRVLNLSIADLLYRGGGSVGAKADRINKLIHREAFADMARRLGVDRHLILHDSEERTGGRDKTKILADAMEAVIGAVKVDANSFQRAINVVQKLWKPVVDAPVPEKFLDYKTMLQELIQKRRLRAPTYELVSQTGPQHAPIFTARVHVRGQPAITGKGNSRKAAEQAAAKALLQRLRGH